MKVSYEDYLKERESLVNAELEESKQFDTYVLTLAGGSFGLSLLFIEKIAPITVSWSIAFLIIAWVSFGLSILATLLSFLISQKACQTQVKILGVWYKKQGELSEKEFKNSYADWTNYLNWISMCLFIAGFIFLVIFSAVNLAK